MRRHENRRGAMVTEQGTDHGFLHKQGGGQVLKSCMITRLDPIFRVDRFRFHDLKAVGISDTDGDKQTASGHKSATMVAVYDRKIAEVKPAGDK
jgi:hypothetical protein